MKNCKPSVFWGVAVLGAILFAISMVWESSLSARLEPEILLALQRAAAATAVAGAVCALYKTLKERSERRRAGEEREEQTDAASRQDGADEAGQADAEPKD